MIPPDMRTRSDPAIGSSSNRSVFGNSVKLDAALYRPPGEHFSDERFRDALNRSPPRRRKNALDSVTKSLENGAAANWAMPPTGDVYAHEWVQDDSPALPETPLQSCATSPPQRNL